MAAGDDRGIDGQINRRRASFLRRRYGDESRATVRGREDAEGVSTLHDKGDRDQA
jgi:hypothetical protein